ncbi:hypothetical protein BASA83_013806 [Batrachochytrium salamandrivorans]|nr:hypothetical protein BASA83_013806 [Batrachochytrium salamandrivorans]
MRSSSSLIAPLATVLDVCVHAGQQHLEAAVHAGYQYSEIDMHGVAAPRVAVHAGQQHPEIASTLGSSTWMLLSTRGNSTLGFVYAG